MLEFFSSVPAVLWYLLTLLTVVLVWFLALKRPVYEAVLVAFVALVACSGTWSQVPKFVEKALSEKTLFSMTAFVAMSVILTKTKVMDGVIAIILALPTRKLFTKAGELLKKVPGKAAEITRNVTFDAIQLAAIAICLVFIIGGSYNPFIYFRF